MSGLKESATSEEELDSTVSTLKHPKAPPQWPKIELQPDQLADIEKAFKMFDMAGMGVVEMVAVKVAVRALGYSLSNREFREIAARYATINSSGQQVVDFNSFVCILRDRMLQPDKLMDIQKMYEIVTANQIDKSEIYFDTLKEMAEDLGEKLRDDELEEMITMTKSGVMDFETFYKIMTIDGPSNIGKIFNDIDEDDQHY